MDIASDQVDLKQYGSIKGTSTEHALIELVHEWKYALDTPETMILILLVDFSKAFDKVDHHTQILLTKCTSLGLPNVIIKYLTSFLGQRKQRVEIGDVKSDFTTINAGVPQGTIFGPIGFIHHINDLQTSCGHVEYVDDCTIWENCSPCGHNSSLQTAATEVAQWTATNKMAFNYDKTKELRICFKRSPLDIPPLTINDRPIEHVTSTQLLGVTLTADLTWQTHIDEITAKASQRLYFIILLNRAGVESHHLVNIYTSLVRSVVESSSQLPKYDVNEDRTKLITIVNSTFNAQLKDRPWAENDAKRLSNCFSNYSQHSNKTASEMIDIFKNVSTDIDCLVVFISSYGGPGWILGADGGSKFSVAEMLDLVNKKTELAGKPRVFILQTCNMTTMIAQVDGRNGPAKKVTIPSTADNLVIQSLLPGGWVSDDQAASTCKEQEHHSLFVETICSELEGNVEKKNEIKRVMTQVVARMKKELDKEKVKELRQSTMKQLPVQVSTARHKGSLCDFGEGELRERMIELIIASTPSEALHKHLLDQDKGSCTEENGVTKKIEHYSDWSRCSSIATSVKKDGSLRVCLDRKRLSDRLKRSPHKIPTLEKFNPVFADARVFSKMDAKVGYRSTHLDDDSQEITTFRILFGRYCYTRLPFGLCVSQDLFQRAMDRTLDRALGCVGIAGDVVVYGGNAEEHDENLWRLTQVAREEGLVFNSKKCVIKTDKIVFFGSVYGQDGIRPDKIEDIHMMPTPQDKEDLQRFIEKETVLEVDASQKGLGSCFLQENKPVAACLLQENKPVAACLLQENKPVAACLLQENKPVAFASKTLTPTQSAYSKHRT
ncbi:hypothetical protein LSAT2_027945 [Lamellibrachia satsuma]|nr:hypothetical protein LSAT2_027945 [Lamellibrachia satsuma]